MNLRQKILRKALSTTGILISSFICFPSTAFGAVFISEIAWMGTAVSANDEWIEIHNDGDVAVDVAGWSLIAEDGSPEITLSGTIAPQSFFILERTDDGSAPGVTADQIYAGALGNTGEVLTLRDTQGVVIDAISMADGWQGGDNTNKYTMQKSGNSWITASPTPRAPNMSIDEGTSDTTDTDTDAEQSSNTSSSSHTNAEELSTQNKISQKNLTLYAGRDRSVVVGQPVKFVGELVDSRHNVIINDTYRWNFGDGISKSGRKVQHEYMFPGNYAVVLTVTEGERTYTARLQVSVREAYVSVVETGIGFVALKNESTFEMNLTGWTILHGDKTFYIPEDTIILPGTTLRIRHPFESKHVTVLPNEHEAQQILDTKEVLHTQEILESMSAEVSEMSNKLSQLSPRYIYVAEERAVSSNDVATSPSAQILGTNDDQGFGTSELSEEQIVASENQMAATVLFEGDAKLGLFATLKRFVVNIFTSDKS